MGDLHGPLRGFWANNNSLSGAIPGVHALVSTLDPELYNYVLAASVASLSALESLDLQRNYLNGIVPSPIQSMPALTRCDFRDNLFSCPVNESARGL